MRVAALLLLLISADEWSDFAKLSKDPDVDKRIRAIDLVRTQRDRRMVEALLPMLADPHARVRHRATQALQGVEEDAAFEFIVEKGLRHPDPRVRLHSLEALAGGRRKPPAAPIEKALSDKVADVRARACEAVATLELREALGRLDEVARRDPDGFVRAFALDALLRLDPGKSTEAYRRAPSDKAFEVRLIAAEKAAAVDPEAGVEVVEALIADGDWRVRSMAFDAAKALRRGRLLGAMIARMAKEKGRLRWDLIEAVVDLADRDLGPDPAPWAAWWAANQATFEPAPRGGDSPVIPTTRGEFFSLPVVSERIVFVLDLSGSMRELSPLPGGLTKLDVAKEGMIRALRSLEPSTRFTILGLGSDASGAWMMKEQRTLGRTLKLRPALPAAVAEAEKFVRGLQCKGWTNLWDGLEYAFEEPEVDTVYLYSDGGASRGIWTSGADIVERLRLMNRFRRVTVHTVEVPGTAPNPPDNVRLLKEIAQATRGRYKLAGEK